jgi:hypothetical protein
MRQDVRNNNWSDSVCIVPPVQNQVDNAINDSDKSFVVPDNELWKITYIMADYNGAGGAGNRQFTIEVQNESGAVVFVTNAGSPLGAGASIIFIAAPGYSHDTSVTNGESHMSWPPDLHLKPGWTLRTYDSNAVAAGADDMYIDFQYLRYVI